MKVRCIIFLLFQLICVSVNSVPVHRVRTLVKLTDGTQVFVTSHGDEHFSYFLTDDGYVVESTDSGFVLTPNTFEEYLNTPVVAQRQEARRKLGSLSTALMKPVGVKRIPVVLVEFKDRSFTVASDSAKVHKFYDLYYNGNPDGSTYIGHGSSGSVSAYLQDESLGQFSPEFVIIGPVRLDNEYSYYGKDSGSTKDVNYGAFVSESLKKAMQAGLDWKLFDNDDNGSVDVTTFVFAGLGQNWTNNYGDKNTIWPKEIPSAYKIDGVAFDGCISCCEMRPTAASGGVIVSTLPDGIGVVLHELSHAFGLPDFYDTKNVAFGMDYWSIMDYGEYANSALTPVGYTAYERDFFNWQPLVTLSEPCTVSMKSFAKGGCGYKIVNDNNPDEYYVLDNRQAYGWDRKLCSTRGHGMLVTHVDYSYAAWRDNKVNVDATHQRMTIIPANNSLIGSNNRKTTTEWTNSLKGNPFPGTSDVHEFTNESSPASVVFAGTYMNKPIYDIEESSDGIITFKFMPLGTLDNAQDLLGSEVTENEALLTWQNVDDAEAYNLRVFKEDELVFTVDSITTTEYTLKDLESLSTYSFSVQAIADKYRNSGWSLSPSFETRMMEDGIMDDISESARQVSVYDMNGMKISTCFADELHRLRLHAGIYIVRYPNGKNRKVLIH